MTIQDYERLYRTIKDDIGLYRTVQDCTGLGLWRPLLPKISDGVTDGLTHSAQERLLPLKTTNIVVLKH